MDVDQTSVVERRVPGWVGVSDAFSGACATLGAFALVFGSARYSAYGLAVSLGSWQRLLLLAFVTALARHLAFRRPSMLSRVIEALDRGRRSPAVRTAVASLIATRLVVLLVGFAAVSSIGYPGGQPPFRVSMNEVANLQARWDAGWYATIASVGYGFTAPAGQTPVVFFPLYPLLVHIVGRLLGDQLLLAGTLVSLAAFLLAVVYIYRAARLLGVPDDSARAGIALLSAYPFALFYSAVYTESLFLLCTAAAVVHSMRQEQGKSAIWGLLAGFVRPNGFLVAVPLAVLQLSHRGAEWPRFAAAPPPTRRPPGARATAMLPVVAPVLALAAYSAYLQVTTGHAFAWAAAQSAWGRDSHHLITAFVTPIFRSTASGIAPVLELSSVDVFNALAVILTAVLVWPVTRRFGVAFGLLVPLWVLPPLLTGGLLSMGRFTSVVFPLFIWLGEAVRREQRPYVVAAFAMGQAFAACLFFTWRPLF